MTYTTTVYPTTTHGDNNIAWLVIFIYLMTSFIITFIVFHLFILIYGKLYNHHNIDDFTCIGKVVINYYRGFVIPRNYALNQRLINRREFIQKNVLKIIHPTSLESTPQINCIICLQEITGKFGLVKCGHKFHASCISTWLIDEYKSTCPICRRDVISEYNSEESVI